MHENSIENIVKKVLSELPASVYLVAVVKGRSFTEIERAISAGIKIIGENYIQEAEKLLPLIGRRVQWHFIGRLQKNKVKKAVAIFDVIQTVDSVDIAEKINY